MKKLLFAAIAVLGFTSVNAQDDTTYGFAESDIFVEGNLSFNSENDKNTETKTNGFAFNPKVGYLISDKLALGVQLGIGSNKISVDGTDIGKATSFEAGAFARYYFLDLGKRFKTYGEFGVGFGSTKNGVDDAVKANGLDLGINLGLNYFVKENIAITFGLADLISYNSFKVDAEGAEAETSFNANLNVLNNFFETAQFGLLFKF